MPEPVSVPARRPSTYGRACGTPSGEPGTGVGTIVFGEVPGVVGLSVSVAGPVGFVPGRTAAPGVAPGRVDTSGVGVTGATVFFAGVEVHV